VLGAGTAVGGLAPLTLGTQVVPGSVPADVLADKSRGGRSSPHWVVTVWLALGTSPGVAGQGSGCGWGSAALCPPRPWRLRGLWTAARNPCAQRDRAPEGPGLALLFPFGLEQGAPPASRPARAAGGTGAGGDASRASLRVA